MQNNKKLVNKTVELSLLKYIIGASKSGVYLPPNKAVCVEAMGQLTPLGE